MNRLTAKLSDLTLVVSSFFLFAMMIHVSLDVFFKYVMNKPIAGTLEIVSTYYMVTAVFLPLAVVELTRSSIAVDFAYQFMPRAMKILCMLLVLVGSAAVYFVLAYSSLGDALRSFRINEQLMGQIYITVWPSRFVLPVSFLLAGLVCVVHLIGFVLDPQARDRLLEPQEAESAANDG